MADRYFLPFGPFAPDAQTFDTPMLDNAENALPIFGNKRPLSRRLTINSVGNKKPIVGSHSHLLLSTEQLQYERPDGTTTQGSYVSLPDQTTALWSNVDEVTASDAEKIAIGGAPDASTCLLTLSDATAPGSTANHVMRMRYRVQNFSSAAAASVTGITRVGAVATFTTAAAHGLVTGNFATFAGATQVEYNVGTQVTITGATTGTYAVSGAPATPATGTITWKKSWGVYADLREGANTRATLTPAIGIADTDYTETSYTLTVGEAGSIASPAALDVRFNSTVPGTAQTIYPTADVSNAGAWTTSGGSTSNLYAEIDDTSPDDDSTYIQTPAMALADTAKLCVTSLPTTASDPYLNSSHVVTFRYRALNSGVRIIAKLMQDTTLIASTTITNAALTYTNGSFTLSSGEADSITDYTLLRLRFDADFPTDVTSTVAQHSVPTADTAAGFWVNELGFSVGMFASLDETSPSDSDFIAWGGMPPSGSTNTASFTLSAVNDPGVTSNHVVKVRAKSSSAGDSLIFKLYCNATLIKSIDYGAGGGDGPLTSSYTTFSHTLSAAEAALIKTYGTYAQLSCDLVAYGATSGEAVSVSYVSFDVPDLRKARVTQAYLSLPSAARAEITWFQFSLPDSIATFDSDRVKLYAGDENSIYEVTSAAWTDVSRAASYGQSDRPASWVFASWGSDLLATNYVDPVQTLVAGSAAFANLITGTEAPQARVMGVINQHVVLGAIDNTAGAGVVVGYPDMLWWSAVDNAADFNPSVTTGSDYQRLRDVPGQIMAIVGGVDYGYVFKRNGIYKLSYVGAPFTFLPQNIAVGIGAASARSIVVLQGDVYFWSGSGFYRMRDGQEIKRIGDGKVDKMLRDYEFESRAVARVQSVDPRVMDALVIGSLDRNSGLIFWSYRNVLIDELRLTLHSDNSFRNDNILVYNPESEEWGLCSDTDLNIAELCSINNPVSDETHLLSGIVAFGYDGNDSTYVKFKDVATYAMTIKSKIISSQAIAGEAAAGRNLNIQAVRPIFRAEPPGLDDPAISVTIQGSDDPSMLSTREVIAYRSNANRDFWYPHQKINGEFFTFQTNVPSLSSRTIADFSGLEVYFTVEGESG